MHQNAPQIAVIIPCHNEEQTVARVVTDIATVLPGASIYVYDNNSSDRTAEVAREAGAIVRSEPRRGKGNVVRRAFADVEADVYLMIDGDDTYDAFAASELVERLLTDELDHVVGVRVDSPEQSAYRRGHAWGNAAFNRTTTALFGEQIGDMFSGYRAFSRRFVKSFPANSEEFEIETELTIHASTLRVPQAAVEIGFSERPPGSESKLRTVRDGVKILSLILRLLFHERPLLVCAIGSAISLGVGLLLGLPVVYDFFQSGEVERFPTAILASSLCLIAAFAMGIGIVVNSSRLGRREMRRLAYLQFPASTTRPAPSPEMPWTPIATTSVEGAGRDR